MDINAAYEPALTNEIFFHDITDPEAHNQLDQV